MKPEIEAKFLNIDHGEMRMKLNQLGAECVQPMRLMKRKVYDFPNGRLSRERNGWVRVRDEGDKVTLSYKQLNDRTVEGTQEVSLVVDSFEQADDFLGRLGLECMSYQETKRESWHLDGCEIELDEWPWLKPYMEIEAADEAQLRRMAVLLGQEWTQAMHGSVEVAYRAEYGVADEQFNSIKKITFDDVVPEILKRS